MRITPPEGWHALVVGSAGLGGIANRRVIKRRLADRLVEDRRVRGQSKKEGSGRGIRHDPELDTMITRL
jgi:hypothetical protein